MRPEGTLTDLPGRSVGETRGCEYIRGGGGEAERPQLLFFFGGGCCGLGRED